MLWQWRRDGKTWEEIKNEYVRRSAVVPGRSSLSVRFSKMEENFITSGAAQVRLTAMWTMPRKVLTDVQDIFLLKVKEDVEKALEGVRWKQVAERFKQLSHQDIRASELRKRWNILKDNDWFVSYTRQMQPKSRTGSDDKTEETEKSTTKSRSASSRENSRLSVEQALAKSKEEERQPKRESSEELRPGDRSRKDSTPPAATHIPSKKRRDFQGLTELLHKET
jgi:hypothetical protein